MLRKTVSVMMLTLLSMGMLTLALIIQPAKASGTIYIRADGSIEGTTYIQTADNVTYVFTADINDSIVVERNDITVDGNGHTLQGDGGGTGIDLSARTNVTVKNTRITDFVYGIKLGSDTVRPLRARNVISENNITNNYEGISLFNCLYNVISGNTVANNGYGIGFDISTNNTVSGNNVTANSISGIFFSDSSSNTLAGNAISNNTRNFGVDGSVLLDFVNYVDASNTVNGKPVCYWVNRQDMPVPSDAGYVALVNCTRITVENLNLTSESWESILVVETTNSTITKDNVANNAGYGIWLRSSSGNIISINTITNNWDGIYLESSSGNIISGNDITNNYGSFGIYATSSSNNRIFGNDMAGNLFGIMLSSSSNNTVFGNDMTSKDVSIWLDTSSGNIVSGNNVTASNHDGIFLTSSSGNIIFGNNITNSGDGIGLDSSSSNIIYHNSFINNAIQVYFYTNGYADVWDNGYPSGGNYWSDYNGTDLFGGPFQNITGKDGLGDTPYLIDDSNRDNYPLMKPYAGLSSDLNGDGTVNILDLAIVARAFGSRPGDPRWNAMADLNGDDIVNILDVSLVAKDFGKTY